MGNVTAPLLYQAPQACGTTSLTLHFLCKMLNSQNWLPFLQHTHGQLDHIWVYCKWKCFGQRLALKCSVHAFPIIIQLTSISGYNLRQLHTEKTGQKCIKSCSARVVADHIATQCAENEAVVCVRAPKLLEVTQWSPGLETEDCLPGNTEPPAD